MGRTVEINIPMFIGIILLIAAMTAMLVFGTNKVRDLMNESSDSYDESANTLESWFERNVLEETQTNSQENARKNM